MELVSDGQRGHALERSALSQDSMAWALVASRFKPAESLGFSNRIEGSIGLESQGEE